MRQQCTLVSVARSGLRIKRLLDEIYVIDPCRRSRSLVIILKRDYSLVVNRKRVQRLRREMGLETIYCQPRKSIPGDGHRKYP
jgi:putative transposase